MKRTATAAAIVATFLIGLSTDALADSRYERLEVKEIKKGGEVVGARFKMTLRPERGHDKVLIGLGPNTLTSGDLGSNSDSRTKARDKSAGYLLHQWDEIKVESGKPQEVTLEVLYKDVPSLKPGADVEIISAWHGQGASYWHVWGLQVFGKDPNGLKKLPGQAAAQRRIKVNDIKRSGRRVAPRKVVSRRATRKPVRNTTAKPKARARR